MRPREDSDKMRPSTPVPILKLLCHSSFFSAMRDMCLAFLNSNFITKGPAQNDQFELQLPDRGQ